MNPRVSCAVGPGSSPRFSRSWVLTNLAKGVIFGTVMAGLPVAGYLLANRSWTSLRRYVWLWGWLLAAGVALAWPVLVFGRHPEILELWKSHYGGRLNQGYLQEPWWYYLVYVPHVIVPWTIPAFVGLWTMRKAAFAGHRSRALPVVLGHPAARGLLARRRQAPPLPAPVPGAVGGPVGSRSATDLAMVWRVFPALGALNRWRPPPSGGVSPPPDW